MVALVRGLVSVKPVDKPPFQLTKSKDGVLAKGIAYENQAARMVKSRLPFPVVQGQWFKYVTEPTLKARFAQTDILVAAPGRMIILECKLTQTPKGDLQLSKLYFPIVSHWVKDFEVVLVQLFRNASYPTSGERLHSLDDILHVPAGKSSIHSFQWLGA